MPRRRQQRVSCIVKLRDSRRHQSEKLRTVLTRIGGIQPFHLVLIDKHKHVQILSSNGDRHKYQCKCNRFDYDPKVISIRQQIWVGCYNCAKRWNEEYKYIDINTFEVHDNKHLHDIPLDDGKHWLYLGVSTLSVVDDACNMVDSLSYQFNSSPRWKFRVELHNKMIWYRTNDNRDGIWDWKNNINTIFDNDDNFEMLGFKNVIVGIRPRCIQIYDFSSTTAHSVLTHSDFFTYDHSMKCEYLSMSCIVLLRHTTLFVLDLIALTLRQFTDLQFRRICRLGVDGIACIEHVHFNDARKIYLYPDMKPTNCHIIEVSEPVCEIWYVNDNCFATSSFETQQTRLWDTTTRQELLCLDGYKLSPIYTKSDRQRCLEHIQSLFKGKIEKNCLKMVHSFM